MLGLIYIVMSAKPISIRRLCLLFAFALVAVRCGLNVFRIEPVAGPVEVSLTLVLIVWVWPAVLIGREVLRTGSLRMEHLESTSATIKFTYGFALVTLLFVTAEILSSNTHVLTVATVSRMLAAATIVAGVAALIGK